MTATTSCTTKNSVEIRDVLFIEGIKAQPKSMYVSIIKGNEWHGDEQMTWRNGLI